MNVPLFPRLCKKESGPAINALASAEVFSVCEVDDDGVVHHRPEDSKSADDVGEVRHVCSD